MDSFWSRSRFVTSAAVRCDRLAQEAAVFSSTAGCISHRTHQRRRQGTIFLSTVCLPSQCVRPSGASFIRSTFSSCLPRLPSKLILRPYFLQKRQVQAVEEADGVRGCDVHGPLALRDLLDVLLAEEEVLWLYMHQHQHKPLLARPLLANVVRGAPQLDFLHHCVVLEVDEALVDFFGQLFFRRRVRARAKFRNVYVPHHPVLRFHNAQHELRRHQRVIFRRRHLLVELKCVKQVSLVLHYVACFDYVDLVVEGYWC